MNTFRSKINNSYESSDSSGSASSAEQRRQSSDFDAMEKGLTMHNLMIPSYESLYESHNFSADEAIFPSLDNINLMAPSYEPDYDYNNEYSTTPLVYSWLPIVPGFSQDGTDNLHNFEHIVKRVQSQPLDISNISQDSTVISDQNVKYAESLAVNSSSAYTFQRLELLDSSKEVTSFSHQLEDSCNAMDLNISCHQTANNEDSNNIDLSFNGKISEITEKDCCTQDEVIAPQFELLPEEEEINEKIVSDDKINKDEEEKIRNESFEMLKKEDSSKMILVNEKSPEVEAESDASSENEEPPHVVEKCANNSSDTIVDVSIEGSEMCEDVTHRTLEEIDRFVKNNINTALSEQCAPPSITTLPLSLSEMLAAYKQNLNKDPIASIKSNSLFIPSHPFNEIMGMEWADLLKVKAHGITYNRSIDCEEIEFVRHRYTDKFIRAETTSSYTHKIGPTSAKKRVEKLRVLTQSPGSRLSHLANRRKVFSSAHLKSTSINASQKSFGSAFLIDKSKLYQKKKTSAKKKTPGKKKTPKSAKRQQLQIAKPQATVASSKRALFTSPARSSKFSATSTETSTLRGVLPRRNLFSPSKNAKRRRSPSPDAENRFGKSRRLESPSKHPNHFLAKSRSFSIAAPSTSTGSLDEHYKKTLFYRTQSEMALNQSMESKSGNSLGLKRPLNEDEKKKLLWSASSALQSKQINREHEKFRDYMSMLCRLVKKLLSEFYHHGKSMSAQMQKFSMLTVYYVIHGRSFEDIYSLAKTRLEAQNPTKVSGYIGPDEFGKNRFIRKGSSLLLAQSTSCTSLNSSTMNSDSLMDASFFDKSASDTSLNRSTSKSNQEGSVLRENFQGRETSARKAFGSESNLNKITTTSTPSSNVLKAKRQISF